MAGKTVKGNVKWFSARRGYGFVSDEAGIDHFVHFSHIQMDGFKRLTAGQAVTFVPGEDENGRSLATMVTPLIEDEVAVDETNKE